MRCQETADRNTKNGRLKSKSKAKLESLNQFIFLVTESLLARFSWIYKFLDFSVTQRPCFIISLSQIEALLAAAVAPPDLRLCNPNSFLSNPMSVNLSSNTSIARQYVNRLFLSNLNPDRILIMCLKMKPHDSSATLQYLLKKNSKTNIKHQLRTFLIHLCYM